MVHVESNDLNLFVEFQNCVHFSLLQVLIFLETQHMHFPSFVSSKKMVKFIFFLCFCLSLVGSLSLHSLRSEWLGIPFCECLLGPRHHTNCFAFCISMHLILTTPVLICPYCTVIETQRFSISCQRSHCWQVKEPTVWHSPYFSQCSMLSVHKHLEGKFLMTGVKNK